MEQKQAFTRITKRVTLEKQPLTYRLTARELGLTVKDAKALLAAYLDTDQAKERGVGAVHLLSGYLTSSSTANGKGKGKASADNGMDVDGDEASSSQVQQQDDEDDEEQIKVRTVLIVPQEDLEAKTALFSPVPSCHVYAITPTPMTTAQLPLLHTASLSSQSAKDREKWRPVPSADEAYGAITHPDGVRKRKPGEGARGGATSAAARAGPSGQGAVTKPAVKKDKEEDVKHAPKGKGKAAVKEKKAPAKKKDDGPKIGQLRGLFSKSFDEPAPKKGKGKRKDHSSDEEEGSEEESEEEVKPKKTIPAKRKSSVSAPSKPAPAPAKKATPAPAPAAASKPKTAPKKEEDDIDMTLDDDDDWAMDEEAFMEAERQAQQQVEAKKAKQAGGTSKPASAAAGKKGKETDAEREQRELEEMMNDDAMDVDEKKPAKAAAAPAKKPALARAGSSSSSSTTSTAKKPAASAAKAQGSINSFFKKK